MTLLEDAELLRHYADEKSEAAFAELVRRHLTPVYAFALRRVGGDEHLAEDVAQVVFSTLARKASSLTDRPVLGGWLCRTTYFAARDVVRTERRRRAREQEAQLMHESSPDGGAQVDWEKIQPLLAQTMGELNDADRDAVWLRFFEGRSFAEVGVRLRLTENAARMRVERALDKLHGALGRRGITSTAAAVGVALAQQAAAAVPAGFAASVTAVALTGLTVAGETGLSTAIFMSITKLQVATAGVVALTGATFFALQSRANAALHREVAALQQQQTAVTALRAENRQLASVAAEVDQLRRDDLELQQLERTALDLRKARQAPVPAASQQGDDLRQKAESFVQKMMTDDQRAQEESERLAREIQAMTAKLGVHTARASDASLSPAERSWAQGSVDTLPAQIEAKKRERQMFIVNTRMVMKQRLDAFRSMIGPAGDAFIVLPPSFPAVGGVEFRDSPLPAPQVQEVQTGSGSVRFNLGQQPDRQIIQSSRANPPAQATP